jgi:AcrR family transcriptional regulator
VATRAAILESARVRFAKEGYDGASLREVAADARVDPALVCRYFGSKEDLFVEVLNADLAASELFQGDPAEFGARVADRLLLEERDAADLDCLLIMLRSVSSPKAAETVRIASRSNFYGPFAAWLGGEDARMRAQLAGALMMGISIARVLADDLDLQAEERDRLRARLADLLQRAVSP